MITTVTIGTIGELRALEDAWARLLERSDAAVTLHPDWMLPWWDVFGDEDGRQLRVVAFYDGAELVGLAPLALRPWMHRPRLRFARLESLASGEAEADETCSEHLGLVAAEGHEDRVTRAFAEALAAGALGRWDELVLRLDGEAPLTRMLAAALARRGPVTVEEHARAPFARLPTSFDAWLDALPTAKREALLRSLGALETWAGGPPVLERARTAEALTEGRRILEALHRAHHPDGGVYRSAKFAAFHAAAMPRLLGRGSLDVGWLSVRGEPVAAFYNLRWKGRAWHYQSGHARSCPPEVAIGTTLQALLVRTAIEEGAVEYDFLAGVLDYKTALTDATRALVTLRAARPSAKEAVRATAARASRAARRVLRR